MNRDARMFNIGKYAPIHLTAPCVLITLPVVTRIAYPCTAFEADACGYKRNIFTLVGYVI